jgi:hypothetical protein
MSWFDKYGWALVIVTAIMLICQLIRLFVWG